MLKISKVMRPAKSKCQKNEILTILPNNQSCWIVVGEGAVAQRIGGHTAEDNPVGEGNLEEEEEQGSPEEGRLGEGILGVGEGIPGVGEGSRELHLCLDNLAAVSDNLQTK